MRPIWSIVIATGFAIPFILSENTGKRCFFSIPRYSPYEKSERIGGMRVSSECSKDLIGLEKLKKKKPQKEYYGAFHDLDVSLTRGAAHYMKSEDDMTGIPPDFHICEKHFKELVTEWFQRKYEHVFYDKSDTKTCSWPFEKHNDKRGLHYLNREEANNYLIATGIHLQLGISLCKEHYDQVISAGEEVNEEQCDPSFNVENICEMADLAETELQKAFFAFCKLAGIDRTCPKKSFMDYTRDTQTRKVRTVEQILSTAIKMIAPGAEDELYKRLGWDKKSDWERQLGEKLGKVLTEINRHYLLADDTRTRYIVLSQAAASLSYQDILPYFDGLSQYKYTTARRIGLSQELPPELTIHRDRHDIEKIEEFVYFIASPHNMVTLPYGSRCATLSSGEVLEIPDVIRINGNAEIIRQFKRYMAEQGKSHLVMSDSTMMRILNELPCTKRHSLTCVDSIKAASYEAFEDFKKMLEELKLQSLIDKDEETARLFNFLEIRHYLKTDFSLHAKIDSKVADHSLIFALSDPHNPNFAVQPTHLHNFQCPRCNHIVTTLREMKEFLTSLSLNSPTNEKMIAEMIFRLDGHKETIEELKAHLIRAKYTELERERLIDNLEDGEALITMDYGQKVIPCKHVESQIEYYGKRGMSWHFSHILAKINGVHVQHTFIHVMGNGNTQDSVAVVTTVEMTLKNLAVMGLHSVNIRSDNAGNYVIIYPKENILAYYHCANTIGSMPSLSKSTGVQVKTWSFSEAQDGKGSADRMTAVSKSKTRRLIHSGKNMEHQDDLITLLDTAPHLKGVSFYLFNIYDNPTPSKPSKISRVTDYSHFEFGEDSVRAWKYRGIGEGVVFKELYLNDGVYTITRSGGYLPNPDSARWDHVRILNKQKATFWHYDPSNIGTGEIKESMEEPSQSQGESDGTSSTDGKKGLTFSCWCGANFIRHGSLLNHLEFGKHQTNPWKATTIDLSLQYYERCLEDHIQVKSLIPLQDIAEMIFDHSIPTLSMGWALRSAKKNTHLPEKTKDFLKSFFLEKKKINKRADPTEAYRSMIADSSIPMDERLTLEQIKRYISRLVATSAPKKKVVVRGKRSSDMDWNDDNGTEWNIEENDEFGEWEMEPECGEEDGERLVDYADILSDHINRQKNNYFRE